MKKLFLITILIFCFCTVSSQPCLPYGIEFTTQAQIDNFPVNYPNCTEIEGDVTIDGSNINNLNGLSILTSIGGKLLIQHTFLDNMSGLDNLTSVGRWLTIQYNWSLNSLTGLESLTSVEGGFTVNNTNSLSSLIGLESLTSVGGLSLHDNNALTSLSGLENLNSITGVIMIIRNPVLPDLSGLDNVTSFMSRLLIYGNSSMTSLTGLEGLTSIGRLEIGMESYSVYSGNASLTSLSGLENVTSIYGDIIIGGNNALTNLSGLDNLVSIDGDIIIVENDTLTSLTGLENIIPSSISNLYLSDNKHLSECEIQSICDYLVSPNGSVNIFNNASGCNSHSEVANSCAVSYSCLPYGNYYFSSQDDIDNFESNYPDCVELEGNVEISGDDISNLNGIGVVTSIGGGLGIHYTDSLTDLSGLENVTFIGDYIDITSNISLSSLAELQNVSSEGLGIYIGRNDTLTTLSGLDNIEGSSITNLSIYSNMSLSTCHVQSICDYLATSPIPWFTSIGDNAPGCNSQEEVEEACEAISVEEPRFEGHLMLYPNPACQELNISAEGFTIDELVIYTLAGQQIFDLRAKGETIDISALTPGMYIVEVMVEGKKIRQKLVVK
jgi:hypothetical protein